MLLVHTVSLARDPVTSAFTSDTLCVPPFFHLRKADWDLCTWGPICQIGTPIVRANNGSVALKVVRVPVFWGGALSCLRHCGHKAIVILSAVF